MRSDADASFESLYRGHRAEVFRAALRAVGNVHDAEDVTQAAFVAAYRAVLAGTEPESPRAWLLTIAENVRRRRFRRAEKQPREEPLDPEEAPGSGGDHEQAQAIVDALAVLPQQQREVFVLREVAGLSYDEIASRTDATVPSVQMALHRARKSLRARLDQQRAGLLVPLPGWLSAVWSRAEAFALAPRAAGAAGAIAIAIGASGAGIATADVAPPDVARPAAVAPAPAPRAALVAAVVPAAPQPRPAPQPVRPAPARPHPKPSPPPVPAAASRPPAPPAAVEPGPAPAEREPAPVPRLLPSPLEHLPIDVAEPVTAPAPLVETPLVAVLEGAGATDAAGAVVPSLPAQTPVSLPPVP